MFKKSNALELLKEKKENSLKQNKLLWINVDIIHSNPENDEIYINELHDKEFRALKEDIRELGIKQALLVKVHPHFPLEYIVISGHRRLQAAKELGLQQVPCMVEIIETEEDKIRSEISLLTTNMLVRERTVSEKAKEIQRMKTIIENAREKNPKLYLGKTLDILAETLGISIAQVKKYNKINLAMDKLDPEVKEDFEKGKLSLVEMTKLVDNLSSPSPETKIELEKPTEKLFEKTNDFDEEPFRATTDEQNDIEESIETIPKDTLPKSKNQSKKNQHLFEALKKLEQAEKGTFNEDDMICLKIIQELVEKLILVHIVQ